MKTSVPMFVTMTTMNTCGMTVSVYVSVVHRFVIRIWCMVRRISSAPLIPHQNQRRVIKVFIPPTLPISLSHNSCLYLCLFLFLLSFLSLFRLLFVIILCKYNFISKKSQYINIFNSTDGPCVDISCERVY